jgi:sucrose-6-phosphate hydrolase SacC (GH32 family)
VRGGWSGELALPRELTLGEDGLLRFRPLEELKRLRHSEQSVRDLAVGADQEVVLDRIAGKALELEVTFEPGGAKQVGVKVCRSPDREEETLVYYDAAEQKLKIDTGKASLAEGPKSVEAAPYVLKPGEPLALRVFVDQSVVEFSPRTDGRRCCDASTRCASIALAYRSSRPAARHGCAGRRLGGLRPAIRTDRAHTAPEETSRAKCSKLRS